MSNEAAAAEIAHRETVREVVEARRRVNALLYAAEAAEPDDLLPRLELQAALLSYVRPLRMIADGSSSDGNGDEPDPWTAKPLGALDVHPAALASVPWVRYADLEDAEGYTPFVVRDRGDGRPPRVAAVGLRALPHFSQWSYTVTERKSTVRGGYTDEEERRVVMPYDLANTAADALDDVSMDLGLGLELPPPDARDTDPF